MANASYDIFQFYKRYKWKAADFTVLQNSLLRLPQALFEGLTPGTVLVGFDVAPSGLGVSVAPGIAVGPSGYLMVSNQSIFVGVTAPIGNEARDLIVVRPDLQIDTQINRPTSPFEIVPLTVSQGCAVSGITGTPAAIPAYPATQANDVVLAGIRKFPAMGSVLSDYFDFSVRKETGSNNNLGQHVGHYDNRLKPYKIDGHTLGIKPSQTIGSTEKLFTSVIKGRASAFPLTAGAFTAQDTTLNFITGLIGGGDGTSGNFAFNVPAAGFYKWHCVFLAKNDTIKVTIGGNGTLAQCMANFRNQVTDPNQAGHFPMRPQWKPIAAVLLHSVDAVTINAFDVFDIREMGFYRETDLFYDAIIGSGPQCTHLDIYTALADADVGVGAHILWAESQALVLPVVLNKQDMKIQLKNGVRLTNAGAVTGFDVSATGVEIDGGRMSGFSVAAIWESGAQFGRLTNTRFASNTTDVIDNSGTLTEYGTISET